MDIIASRGFDVYFLDLPGYGKSTRPSEMSEPPEANEPLADTLVAERDVARVVDCVLHRRGIQKLCLMGWSWGTSIMASYATKNSGKVDRLVLYAPVWLRTTPALLPLRGKLGAYRSETREAALSRWLAGVPESEKADLIPDGWFKTWADATFASDPEGAAQSLAHTPSSERRTAGCSPLLVCWKAVLRTCENQCTHAARAGRVGPRYAALHGGDAVSAAD